MHVGQGECVGLLGTNGAGKSTTIRILTGQLQFNSGSAEVFGICPSREPKKVHSILGYVPDDQSLYDDISVWQNVEVFRRLRELPRQRSEEILELLSLRDKANARVRDLSRGLRQRVLLARSILHEPKVLLLDEPSTGLDPNSVEDLYGLLSRLREQGTSILLSTHLMNDVERLCDRVVFLNKGHKVEEGKPFALKRKYRRPVVSVQIQKEGRVCAEEFFDDDPDLFRKLELLRREGALIAIHSHEPKLEEIFIKLVNPAGKEKS